MGVIDAASREIIKVISFELSGIHDDLVQPVGILLTSDGKLAFVALGPANHVAVVDAQTFEVKDHLLVGQRVWQLEFSPDEWALFTTNGLSNDVTIIDVQELKPVKSVAVGRFPWGIAVRP